VVELARRRSPIGRGNGLGANSDATVEIVMSQRAVCQINKTKHA